MQGRYVWDEEAVDHKTWPSSNPGVAMKNWMWSLEGQSSEVGTTRAYRLHLVLASMICARLYHTCGFAKTGSCVIPLQ